MWPFRHKWTKRMRQHRALVRADEKLDRELDRLINWGTLPEGTRTAQERLNMERSTNPTNLSANVLLTRFLMSCYLYYVEDVCVLTDAEFDAVTEELKKRWTEVTHPHKELISMDDLVAGTGYAIKYPNSLIGAARAWYNMSRTAQEDKDAPVNQDICSVDEFKDGCKDCC